MTAKTSAFQIFAIMLMGRAFAECLNVPNEVSHYGMQRFTVIFISRVIFMLVCIPIILFVTKYPKENFFTVLVNKSKILGWIIFLALASHLIFLTVILSVKFEFYIQNTIMSTASSFVLTVLFFTAVVYGVVKGLQSTARIASVLIILFFLFLTIIGFTLIPKIDLNYLYPAIIDNYDIFWVDIYEEIVKNSEIYIFLILSRYIDKKPARAIYLFIPLSLLIVEYMHFLFITILGPYLNYVSFPFYTVSSRASVVILDRLDGLDMIIWTITMLVEVILLMICIKTMLYELVSRKKAQAITVLLTFASGTLSLIGSIDRSSVVNMYSSGYMGITLIVFVVILPLISYFIRKGKKDVEKDKKKIASGGAVPVASD